MAAEPFTPEELESFKGLLLKLKDHNGFWPTEKLMRLAHGKIPYPATELVIIRENDNKKPQILLSVYNDAVEMFQGMWHIPGGYMKWGLWPPGMLQPDRPTRAQDECAL